MEKKYASVSSPKKGVSSFQQTTVRYGNGRVADNPFARLVDMRAGGQIHNRVRTPAQRPHHFFDFFGQAGGYGRVAQVAVDFDAEVAADNHRFEFGVVDVGGDNRASGGDFLAHKFGRDLVGMARDVRAETLPLRVVLKVWCIQVV